MSIFRPEVERIAGYVPGEQPQESGWVKLNTNENPYPPSPQVVDAIKSAAADRLNVYPDPLATQFRCKAAELFGLDPDWILPANGSDEILTILLRTFVGNRQVVAYPYPSYILYETLADLQGADHERLHLNQDWSWDFSTIRSVIERSKLVLVPNPNSPSGNRWENAELCGLIPPDGILGLDEAYGDFGDSSGKLEILKGKRGQQVVITRTLSKSYSLAGIRFGFALAHPELIAGMRKVKDSYNCNSLSLAAAVAALEDRDWMVSNVAKIRATRDRLEIALADIGFEVVPSQANFVWATHRSGRHLQIYESLKQKRILVRYMQFADARSTSSAAIEGLRITVGTDAEIDQLLQALTTVI